MALVSGLLAVQMRIFGPPIVTPAKAGVHRLLGLVLSQMDSGFRRNDTVFLALDCRVKPGNDNLYFRRL